MSLNRSEQLVSVQDYLEAEKESPVRHEYVDGYIYAMAGASDRHNRISLNIASRLNQQLADGPSEVFMSDMKLRVAANVYYYPDIIVCCDSPPPDAYFRAQPALIVEVMSPTTERIDHHEKLVAYKRMDSLRECVLISQDQVRVEVHRRIADDWRVQVLAGVADNLMLDSVGLSVTLAEIYRGVRFPE